MHVQTTSNQQSVHQSHKRVCNRVSMYLWSIRRQERYRCVWGRVLSPPPLVTLRVQDSLLTHHHTSTITQRYITEGMTRV